MMSSTIESDRVDDDASQAADGLVDVSLKSHNRDDFVQEDVAPDRSEIDFLEGNDGGGDDHNYDGDGDGDVVYDSKDVGMEMSPLLMVSTDDNDDEPTASSALAPGTATQSLSRRKTSALSPSSGGLSCLRKKTIPRRGGGAGREVQSDESSRASEQSTDGSGVVAGGAAAPRGCIRFRRVCRDSASRVVRTTVSVMNLLARILLWGSFFATTVGVVWYSRELRLNGTDPHLIAWFSAGAFVLLGFPISMYGIFMHLSNYYQPNVQCYVVRILWMVPIYSIESWLCLRFHTLAIYIETLRDCYESYVLYSFLQFLIMVLGGEEALVLMLKDKSPTRGVHMAPLNWCVSPWLMGQPIMRKAPDGKRRGSGTPNYAVVGLGDRSDGGSGSGGQSVSGALAASTAAAVGNSASLARPAKQVQWTSPFFVRCKFGVLQYVLLKFVSSIFVMLLEMNGLYKEGDFTPRGGYLYICILTNLSQCWALYCLVFFYYATKNELGPIRPVGKFLSVKAVVFFTWWQSLAIAMLFQMGMIPHYAGIDDGREWTSEAVAKGLQDYLICIEMFVAAIVHTFVFPHTDYLEPLANFGGRDNHHHIRRLGRKGRPWDAALAHQYHRRGDDKSLCSKNSGGAVDFSDIADGDLELGALSEGLGSRGRDELNSVRDDGLLNPERSLSPKRHSRPREGLGFEQADSTSNPIEEEHLPLRQHHKRQGFVRALLDSTVPRDVFDETVGIVKGDYHVEKKTLLHHAATSDEYDLFSASKRRRATAKQAAARAAKSAGATGNRRLGAAKSNRGCVTKSSLVGTGKDALD